MNYVNKLYNEHAKYYDRLFGFQDKYDIEIKFIDGIIKKHRLGNRIADFGCGTGNHLTRLEKLGYSVIGINKDISMLDIAKTKTNSKLIEGNIGDIKLKEEQDAIICMWGVISHLESDKELILTLNNFYDNLKKDGVLIIDLRYSEKMKDYKVRERTSDGTYLLSQWIDIEDINATYDYAYIINDNDKIISNHSQLYQKFLDPFWFSDILKEVGFKNISIYENYDLEKPYKENSNTHICPIVSFKQDKIK